jgi:hypothetical protein
MRNRVGIVARLGFTILPALLLCGCQSTGHSRAELNQICADPASRAPTPGNLYYDECQAINPSTSGQLRNNYLLNAPTGDE